jgi:hypothetical protein
LQVSRIRWCIFFAEAVDYVAVAAFAAVDAITLTSELPAPAILCGEALSSQPGQFVCPGTVCHSLIQDLQSLLAVDRRGQSSSSSPQMA